MNAIAKVKNKKTLKAKVAKEGNFWVGQVYGHVTTTFLGIPMGERTGWCTVTDRCFTKIGAIAALKIWKLTNCEQEIDL